MDKIAHVQNKYEDAPQKYRMGEMPMTITTIKLEEKGFS
jgi:hypothetical protein